MYSQQLIRFSVILIFVQLFAFISFGQNDSIGYVKSPYHKEATPYFKFGQFKRGFSNEILKQELDSLEAKPRKLWSREDSLHFAQVSLQTGNIELSEFYFDRLDVDFNTEADYWYNHLVIHFKLEEFDEGISLIRKSSPMIFQFSKVYFYLKIFEAKQKNTEDPKWYKSNTVLDWDVDTSLFSIDKDSEEFQEELITPLHNLESVLKRLIAYVHEEDPIISRSCLEMGIIIENHLSLSQAYVSMSLGRHYNKWDKDLLAQLKRVKGKMTEKKLKIPNFRKYFPRIEYWRFDYEVLKEKVISAKNDTLEYAKPKTMKPKVDPLLNFPSQYIIIGGILLFFILILLILKTKSK